MSDFGSPHDDQELLAVGASAAPAGVEFVDADGGDADDLDEEDERLLAAQRQAEQDDANNAVNKDGTRERNLTLWEASFWWQKVYAVFESGSFPSDIPVFTENISNLWALFMFLVIVLSSATVLIESYPEYQTHAVPNEVALGEVFSVVIFTFDMVVRLIVCPSKLKYILDVFNWIDLVAILPFYVTDIGGYEFLPELRMVRVLRLVRMLRVLRSRKLQGLNQMIVALQTSMDGLILFIALAGIALLIASTSAYYAERGSRDRQKATWYRDCAAYKNCTTEVSPFQSIPDSFWWATATLSTVGYGDVVTTSELGKFVACLTMLAGVYILAFPTMILSGNFDAARKFGAIVNYGWDVSGLLKTKASDDSPRTSILKRLGWYDDDLDARREAEIVAAPTQEHQETMGMTLAGAGGTMTTARPNQTRAGRRRRKRAGPQPIGAFLHANVPRYIYRDSSVNEHQYWYEPLMQIATCDDGGPSARVIWGSCGQPTLVQLTIILDILEAREEAVKIVEGFDSNGKVKCDIGSGVEVRHWSSAKKPGETLPFEMLPARITGSYRNSDLPINFKWTGHESDLMMMTEDEVAELALSSLLGTSLHVSLLVTDAPVLKRLAIVQQVIHHTRLQRELELIAAPAEYGGDLMAYVARPDVEALLNGVSAKMIVDPSLAFEDVKKLERDIVDAVLARVRGLRLVAVPKMARSGVYNGELLSAQSTVYEFPMSLFKADEADEVEEDALGYTHVRMRSRGVKTFRLDIRMDNAPDDLAYEEADA